MPHKLQIVVLESRDFIVRYETFRVPDDQLKAQDFIMKHALSPLGYKIEITKWNITTGERLDK